MTFAAIAAAIGLAVAAAAVVTVVAIVAWSDRRRAGLPSMTGLEVVAWVYVGSSWLVVAGAGPWWLAGGTYAIGAVVAVAPARELLASKTRRSPRTVAAVPLAAILWPGLAVVVAYRRGCLVTAHAHAWTPVDGAAGQYRCACGTWGRRPRHGGAIVERRTPYCDGAARPTVGYQPPGLSIGGKAPSLDEQERQR